MKKTVEERLTEAEVAGFQKAMDYLASQWAEREALLLKAIRAAAGHKPCDASG